MMFGREEEPDGLKTTLLGGASERGGLSALERTGDSTLSMRDCHSHGDSGECPLAGINLDVWPGEILGIAGVDGNGQKHFAEALAGQRGLSAGSIHLAGEPIEKMDVIERRVRGVRYITDERLGEGTASRHSVATNLILKEIGNPPYWRHGLTRVAPDQ